MFLTAIVSAALLLSVASGDEVIGNVAFTAGFSEDTVYQAGQIIQYPLVTINHGSGYNSSTGIFTSPKGALYVFHVYGLTVSDKAISIGLYQNDKLVISVYAHQVDDFAAGGNSVSLKLKKNDIVYVKARSTTSFFGRSDEVYGTITGYMIGLLTANE